MALKRGQNIKYLPYAFTEYGALMAANVLNSSDAVRISVYVIRAFVKIREELTANSAIVERLAQIDDTLFLHDSVLRSLPKTASTSRASSTAAAETAHRVYTVAGHPQNASIRDAARETLRSVIALA